MRSASRCGTLSETDRETRTISQDKLAELSGLDRGHVFRLESAEVSMRVSTLQVIAEALGVRVRDLIGEL